MQSSRRGEVDPFIVMDVMEAARRAEAAGRHIIHMEVGQPGTLAPKGARDAVAAAMERDPLGYSVSLGIPALRERIARLYGDRYGVDLDPGRVVVTSVRRVRSCRPSPPCSRPGRGLAWGRRGIRPAGRYRAPFPCCR